MTALPPLDEVLNKPLERNAKSVYEFILTAEKSAQAKNHPKNLMYSRVVGYLLLQPPTYTAFSYVQRELASCNRETETKTERNERIYALGQMYFDGFLRQFKKACGPTPASSEHPSRTSFEGRRQTILQDLQNNKAPQNHKSAKQAALIRDGYRCMVTHAFDLNNSSQERFQEWMRNSGQSYVAPTQCCHIIPESVNNFESVKDKDKNKDNMATFWTIVHNFGYADLHLRLKDAKIHDLSNIMTLHFILHDKLDSLQLWFDEVENEENTYKIRYGPGVADYLKYALVPVMDKVTFNVDCSEALPLPDPRYLQLHAACCRIAHLSAAAEYLDEIDRDIEELPVLSHDGGSADVLALALQRVVDPAH